MREVRYDPYMMAATAQRLTRAGLNLSEFNQAIPNLTDGVTKSIRADQGAGPHRLQDDGIDCHLARPSPKRTRAAVKFAKDETSPRIDIVVALAMAAIGAVKKGEAPRMWINSHTKNSAELHMQQVKPGAAGGQHHTRATA